MSELLEIKIPDLGGADEVEIVEILIQPGDAIEPEQTLAVMESDKATMDLPANMAGTIQEVIIKVGDKVSQDSLVAMLRPGAVESVTEEKAAEPAKTEAKTEQVAEKKVEAKQSPVAEKKPEPVTVASNSKAHATPSVRLFARELGVDLSKIQQGSGRKGRILREDVQSFVKKAMAGGTVQGGGAGRQVLERRRKT